MTKTRSKSKATATTLSHIAEQLRPLAVAIDELSFDKENARVHSERNIKTIETSLKQYGQRLPIIVQRDGMIVRAGNGRLRAAINLGWKFIAAVISDDAETTAKAFALIDNKSSELAEWDVDRLSQLLDELSQADVSLEMTGFDDVEFERISAGDYMPHTEKDDVEESEREEIVPKVKTYSIFSKKDIVDEAFRYFRKAGFPYPHSERHESMQRLNALYDANDDVLIRTTACGIVADTYHKHRFNAAAQNMKSPVESFNKDTAFKKVLSTELDSARVGTSFLHFMSLVNGTQACANFRPGYALWIYRKYGVKGGVLLDTSTGYGGRLVGFLCSDMNTYIGIDPNPDTFDANYRIRTDLGGHKCIQLINQPAEDVKSIPFESCDLAFPSPPYFSKEIYSHDDTQSWKRYKTFDDWLDGFLRKMLGLQLHCLKDNAFNVINIADVKIGKTTYPLERETVTIAEQLGFEHVETLKYPLSSGPQNMGKERFEPTFVFRKRESENA